MHKIKRKCTGNFNTRKESQFHKCQQVVDTQEYETMLESLYNF